MLQEFHFWVFIQSKQQQKKIYAPPCSLQHYLQQPRHGNKTIQKSTDDEQIKKIWCVYKHNGILFSHKKKDILPSRTTWMDLKDIMLSEISQTKKDKYHMISLNEESGGKKKKKP